MASVWPLAASAIFVLVVIALTDAIAKRGKGVPVSERSPISVASHNQSGGVTCVTAIRDRTTAPGTAP